MDTKTIFTALILVAATLIAGPSVAQVTFGGDTTQAPGGGEMGQIMFMRTTGMAGSATAIRVFIDEKFVCKLNNNKYSLHEVPAGKHLCSSQFGGLHSKDKAEKFEVEVKPGETVYMSVIFETGAFANNTYVEEVTKRTADWKMPRMEQDTKCR